MKSGVLTTTDPHAIKIWAEIRGGYPMTLSEEGTEVGILKIDFSFAPLGGRRITWEEFFAKFKEKDLVFAYEEKGSSGRLSKFYKLISHERIHAGLPGTISVETKEVR